MSLAFTYLLFSSLTTHRYIKFELPKFDVSYSCASLFSRNFTVLFIFRTHLKHYRKYEASGEINSNMVSDRERILCKKL